MPNISLPAILTIKLTGVRIIKNIKPITIGAIIIPNISPNLIQQILNGDSSFEFNNPRIRKIMENNIRYRLKSSPFFNGHNPIAKKTKKNNKPKLLLELFDFIVKIFNLKIFEASCPFFEFLQLLQVSSLRLF